RRTAFGFELRAEVIEEEGRARVKSGFGRRGTRIALPAGRMTCVEAVRVASIRIPAGSDRAAIAHIGSIEAQTADDGEGVPIPRINRDPTTTPACPIATKIVRGQRRVE